MSGELELKLLQISGELASYFVREYRERNLDQLPEMINHFYNESRNIILPDDKSLLGSQYKYKIELFCIASRAVINCEKEENNDNGSFDYVKPDVFLEAVTNSYKKMIDLYNQRPQGGAVHFMPHPSGF